MMNRRAVPSQYIASRVVLSGLKATDWTGAPGPVKAVKGFRLGLSRSQTRTWPSRLVSATILPFELSAAAGGTPATEADEASPRSTRDFPVAASQIFAV